MRVSFQARPNRHAKAVPRTSEPTAGPIGPSVRKIDTMTMHETTKPSFSRRWEDSRPSKAILFWACVAAILVTMAAGFGWGGWVTGGTSLATAATAADKARGDLASAICVERFTA